MAPNSTRRKILWLVKGLGAGGAEKLLSLSLPHLDRERYDYEVAYLLPWKRDLVPEFEAAGIKATCLNVKKGLDPGFGLRLASLLRKNKIDLLHSHSPYPAIIGKVISRFAGVSALVHTEHNLLPSYNPVTRLLHRLTTPMTRATIAVSEEVRRTIVDTRLPKPRNLRVVYGGIDPKSMTTLADPKVTRARFGIPDDHFVIGNVAHLRSQKGYGFFLQAAKIILDRHPTTTFVIVGREKEAGYQSSLERQAEELGIKERVVFTGFQPDSLNIMATFDLLLMSSLYEGLPVALMEAMAQGKPIVLTSVGGVREAVEDGVEGFLVPPRDPAALAERALTLIGDDALRERMGGHARQTVLRKFTVDRMVRETEEVYEEVLGERAVSTYKAPIAGLSKAARRGQG